MNKEPRIIFSLDAYPLINNRWYMGNKFKETIYMTALSVLYAHLWYRDIELYVDKTAYKFLYMLPCRVTKIDIKPEKDLWMKAKIHAIQKQVKPFVHLDTDVFIKKKIKFDFDKVLLEREEGGYKIHYKKQLDFFNEYTKHIEHWHEDLGRTFSCGVLGFNDMSLRNKFVYAYHDVAATYKENRENFLPLKKLGFEPCIVIEQYNLASLLNHQHIEPDVLLTGNDISEHSKQARRLGYSHLFGVKKYKQDIEKEIEYRLFKIFPHWYGEVKKSLEKARIIEKDTSHKSQVA